MVKNKIVLKIILVLFVTMSCSDKKNKTKKVSKNSNSKSDDFSIPKNTLKLIEEAEKSKN